MKKQFTKFGAIIAAAIMIGSWFVAPSVASSGRDCDTNAVLYCGALSTTELANKINNGASGPNQSPTELKALFSHYGISTNDFGMLKTGWVNKNGEVWVDHKRVYTGAKSIGRHNIAGSTKLTFVNYPLYIRPTSVSFVSNSLEAFVYLNPDGTMAYAVLKACGNIVPGVGKTYRAYALKWIDVNGNGKWDLNENTRQAGVSFTLTGNGVTKTVKTDNGGYAWFNSLKPGTYTIKETVPAGYTSTTGVSKTIVVNHDKTGATFGNRKVQPLQVQINVRKFEDIDGDRTQDQNEPNLSGWQFRVTGNGVNRTITTDSNGRASVTGLQPGNYTVTEINRTGWANTTGLSIARNVTTNPATQTFVFGNQRIREAQVQLQIRKFEDIDGDKVQDENELNLEGWQFRVTGNGFDRTVATDANGQASITGLRPGVYRVTEINKAGWINTTGLGIERNVTTDANTQLFVFGNQKVKTPETPETPLPTSGPGDVAATMFASMSLSGFGLSWLKSKKKLAKSLRK